MVPFCEKQEIVSHNIKMKLYKFANSTTSEIIDRTTEFSSKWIITSGIMWENINANYTEEYGSVLKVKNQVNNYNHCIIFSFLARNGFDKISRV